MSSVLHPVGPEPPQTYWVRRLLVVASSILILVLLIAVIVSATKSGSANASGPSAPPTTATGQATTAASADVFTPSPNYSADLRTPGARVASPTATTKASAQPTAAAKKSAPSPTAKPSDAAPTTCAPSTLRTTLTGQQRLMASKSNTLTLSLINGGPASCVISVTPANFTLKIYSGSDRIWTTADCGQAIKPIAKRVASQAAVEWQIIWNGHRSAKACKSRPETVKPGTYVATAQLAGAKAVQLRMVLHR